MPKGTPSTRTPKYRRQRRKVGNDLAFVELEGRRIHLGRWDSAESRARYHRLIAEWAAGDGTLPVTPEAITVVELVDRFSRHADGYYRKADGTPTSEVGHYKLALRPLRDLYGRTKAAEFGPRALKAVRQWWVDRGAAREYANKNTDRIRRLFKWGASEELVPAAVWHSLQTVAGLKRGRTAAHETEGVGPVGDHTVDVTLPHLTPTVRGMVEIERLTGMRPGEVCIMRVCDLDMSGTVWTYKPGDHKTAHRSRIRTIYIGPRGQEVLRPFLRRELAGYLFSPAASAAENLAERNRSRKTPLSCGNRPGTNRRRHPKRRPKERYTPRTYAQAVERACKRAFPAPEGTKGEALKAWRAEHRWSPGQLRHTYSTEIRREYGLEAAQVLLGHAKADVTQVYAERDAAKAVSVAAKIG